MILLDDLTRICSGFLVNNTDEDETNYFQTAFHCADIHTPLYNGVLSQAEIDDVLDWVVFFNYESPACSPETEPQDHKSLSGTTLKARGVDSDFLLVELSEMTPNAWPYYLGGLGQRQPKPVV